MLKIKHFLFLFMLTLHLGVWGANRYWVANSPSNWNNPLNWSATSGGAPGATIPSTVDFVFFNNLGPGNCLVDGPVVIDGINTTGYTGIINLANQTFNPASSGNVACTFGGGSVTGTVGNTLNFSTNSAVSFGTTLIGVPVIITGGYINLSGAVFNGNVTFTNQGLAVSSGNGGNTFNGNFNLTSFGSNFFNMGMVSGDIFNGVATFKNQGSSRIRVAYSGSGHQFNNNIIVGSTSGNGVSIGENGGMASLAATRIIQLDGIGFTSGELRLANLNQLGGTAQTLLLTGAAVFYSINSNWTGNVDFRAPSMKTDGTDYLGTAFLQKTGSSGDNSLGGNVFSGNCTLRNSGTGVFSMGNTGFDIFSSNLTVENIGTNFIYIAATSAGNQIGGDLIANDFCVGTPGNSGLYFCAGSASTLIISGNAVINGNATATTSNVHFGYNGNLLLQGNLTINNTSVSNNFHINLGYLPTSIVTVNGNTVVNHGGSGLNNRVVLGFLGDCTFNGFIQVYANCSATNSEVRFNHAVTSNNTYNGNIELSNNGASSDGIRFGETGGTGTMTAGYEIKIGSLGYNNFVLDIRNFTQLGTTAQNLSLITPLTYIWMQNCVWNGPFTSIGQPLYLNGNTFNNTSYFDKTDGFMCTNNGGNTFNGPTTIKNSSTTQLTYDDLVPNDYNSDVTFINTGTSQILPSNQCASTYAGNINITSNYAMFFANTGASKIIMDGTGPQSINATIGTPKPNFNYLQTNNAVSDITLNTAIILKKFLELTQGNIITSTVNSISIDPTAVVLDVDDDAYIDGPCVRAGTAPFTFPVGGNGAYRPISVGTSPTSQVFSAQYYGHASTVDGIPNLPIAAGMDHISFCEYWVLNRVFGSVGVDVTLSYKDWSANNCSGVLVPAALRVAKWNGSSWLDLGNGGFGGSASNGWVLSGGTINSFSPFTLATTIPGNPLPIELLSFEAKVEETSVRLNWSTASELNNDFFEVERSANGYDFEPILYQKGAGNSSSVKNYTDVDRYPLLGLSYYRLKQVDFDGKISYSDIKAVNFDQLPSASLFVYPNPSKDFLAVRSENDDLATLQIFNTMGQNVSESIQIDFNNKENATLDLRNLPAGVYLLRSKTQAIRFTKL